MVTAWLPAWLVGARLSGLYRRDGRPTMNAMAHERVSLGHFVLIGTALCLLVALATESDDPAREGLARLCSVGRGIPDRWTCGRPGARTAI